MKYRDIIKSVGGMCCAVAVMGGDEVSGMDPQRQEMEEAERQKGVPLVEPSVVSLHGVLAEAEVVFDDILGVLEGLRAGMLAGPPVAESRLAEDPGKVQRIYDSVLELRKLFVVLSKANGSPDPEEGSPPIEDAPLEEHLEEAGSGESPPQVAQQLPPAAARVTAAFEMWSHLIPAETADERRVLDDVNAALRELATSTSSQPDYRGKMETLVNLICNPEHNRAYANYAHMVFADALFVWGDEESGKYGGMLASIASCGCADPGWYWQGYKNGYYNRCPTVEDDCEPDASEEDGEDS
ncbi:MAG: hypothetical protein LBF54_03865 [Holosporaceae bacterium]|nr:hypothetical protein [Holosporaceae bacterium]